jgi:pimeloyl-ACP methyl ester carboxylesterase
VAICQWVKEVTIKYKVKNLLLLHGALGSSDQFTELSAILKNNFNVYSFSFSGHGANSKIESGFSIELFGNDVVSFLDSNQCSSINIFGYSMGGYVALYFASFFPERVHKIFTLATKFNWTPESSAKETSMLNPDVIEMKVPAFANSLAQRHGNENWKNVVKKTVDMMLKMGTKNPLTENEFRNINCPVMLGLGDRDQMVTKAETEKVLNLIPKSEMHVFNEMPHAFEKINIEDLAETIRRFFV